MAGWQRERETGAAVGGILGPDAAVVCLHDAFGDGQAQARAAGGAAARLLAAVEALEDVREVGRRDSLARVAHLNPDLGSGRPRLDRHTAAGRRVRDGLQPPAATVRSSSPKAATIAGTGQPKASKV